MAHTKRNSVLRKIPIPRKGTKYVVRALDNRNDGIPILVAIRDMLTLAKTRKEVKKILNKKEILVNNKIVKDDRSSLVLFDVISVKSTNKNYSVQITKEGKFKLEEISAKESKSRVCKVLNKKAIDRKKIQFNLDHGRNIILNIKDSKIKTGDSIILNLENKKIEKHLPLKEGSKIFIQQGKHIGVFTKIKKIDGRKVIVEIDGKQFKIKDKELIVI